MNLYTAILYIGAVNIWRGLWMLYDLYLLPGICLHLDAFEYALNQLLVFFNHWKNYFTEKDILFQSKPTRL